MGGVIPIIFAISIVLFPTMIAQFFVNAKTELLRDIATWTIQVFQNQLIYGILYFVLVFVFAYFYTAVIFHPDQVAENIQKQGGFIPGIRPGKNTADYLGYVVNRLLLVGAGFLALVAILPLIVQQFTGNANLVIGGTSILIIVAVVIDSVKQIESQVIMREYDA
jgi:preprotein translocase subunit SecY